MSIRVLAAIALMLFAHATWAGDFRLPDQHLRRSDHPSSFAPATTGTSVLLGNGTGGFSLLGGNTLGAHNFATSISVTGVLSGAQPAAGDIAAGTFAGADTFAVAPIFSSISGSTQCLQVNSSGQTSGTGSTCGTTAFLQASASAVEMVNYGGL